MVLDFISAAALVTWVILVLVLLLAFYEISRLLLKRSATVWDRIIALAALLGIIVFLLTKF
jgi:hypothetical protein